VCEIRGWFDGGSGGEEEEGRGDNLDSRMRGCVRARHMLKGEGLPTHHARTHTRTHAHKPTEHPSSSLRTCFRISANEAVGATSSTS
jgi:hypothetical protein